MFNFLGLRYLAARLHYYGCALCGIAQEFLFKAFVVLFSVCTIVLLGRRTEQVSAYKIPLHLLSKPHPSRVKHPA